MANKKREGWTTIMVRTETRDRLARVAASIGKMTEETVSLGAALDHVLKIATPVIREQRKSA